MPSSIPPKMRNSHNFLKYIVAPFYTKHKVCPVRILDMNQSERIMDNSIFYTTFVSNISKTLELTDELKNELMINSNLAM